MSRTEIVFNIACSGWRRVHTVSEENGVNEIISYPASRLSRVNVGRMYLVVIHYQTVRAGSPDEDTWRIPVSDSKACLGLRSLGIVGLLRSAIVTAVALGQRNRDKDVVVVEIHPLLPQRIRAITYRFW